MKRLFLVALSLTPAFICKSSLAELSATWTGAKDNLWTNAANWLVNGVVPEKCPGVISNEVDGVFSPDLPSGDIAIFDGTCTSDHTTINLEGLYSVKGVYVQGETCPKYTFGISQAQILPLETNGIFQVDATIPPTSCPVVNAELAISNFDYSWWKSSSIGRMLSVINNSTGTIEFNSSFATQMRRPDSNTGYKEFGLELHGCGNFRFTYPQAHNTLWLPTYYYKHTGTLEINADFTEQKRVIISKSSRVAIADGCTYGTFVGNNIGYEVASGAIFTVEGDGTFRFTEHKGSKLDNCGYTKVSGGAIVIHSKVQSYASSSAIKKPRIILADTSYDSDSGLKLYGPPGDIPGGVLFRGESQLVVESTNSLGNCSVFTATNSVRAAFRWSGMSANEALAIPIEYIGNESSTFSIWNTGKVPFTVLSEVTAGDTAKTLALHGSSATIVCAPNIVGNVSLRLSGDVTIPADISFANCPKIEVENCKLAIEGDSTRTLPLISVLSGENSVSFADSMNLALPGVSITDGSIDFKVEDSGATIVVQGKNAGSTSPDGLLIDGHKTKFDENGKVISVKTDVDISISSRGDSVPNDSSKSVGITKAGTGGENTLASDHTSVKAIIQQSKHPSAINIADKQSLTTDKIAVEHDCANLTIGSASGMGTIQASSSSLNLRNDSYAAPLIINSKIASTKLSNDGKGTVVLTGGMEQSVDTITLTEGETILSNATWNTTADSKILVTKGARLVAENGARLISDIGINPIDVNKPVIELDEGLFTIQPGAVVTNMIVLNQKGEGKIAAVQQNGGSVFAQGNPTANFYLFGAPRSYSQGYWEVAGGTLCLTGRISMCGDRSAVALRQSGGKIIHRNSSAILRIGAGAHAYAEYIMTGGKSEFLSVNLRDWGNFVGTTSTLTVDGEDAVFTVLGNLQIVFQNTSNPVNDKTYGILNLVSGTFCANSAVRGGGNDIAIERTMTHGLINFNGGTFKTRIDIGSKTSDGLFGGTPDQATKSWVDYVTVYSGGATIETDSNNRKVYIRTPLRKPTGKGIRSITPLCKRTKLIAPPHVIIEGDGQGASAYAEFDKEKGEVTGIRIASPGWGYTTVSARLLYGSPNFSKGDICSVELEDVESGNLTKKGPGTLVLAAANTYTGETILQNGTLELSVDGALPETSAVSYQGGALTSTAEAFPEILRVRIPGAENGTVRRLKLATFIDACPSVLPDVELVNVSDDENRNWVPEFRGSSLYVRRVFGTVLSVR